MWCPRNELAGFTGYCGILRRWIAIPVSCQWDRPGIFPTFRRNYYHLDNSSCHVAGLKCFKRFDLKINFESNTQATSREGYGPDLDAFESAARA